MPRQSVFADEWRACLREQYKYVVRNNDAKTTVSLTDVMHEAGFTDDELAELRVLATLRADKTPDDFMPDMHVLESEDTRVFPAALPDTSDTIEDDLSETSVEMESDAVDTEEDDSDGEESRGDDAPQQLSLFG